MGKIYAQPMNPEYVDTENYYTEDDASNDHIWIGGNRHFIEFDGLDKESLINSIENCHSDLYDIDHDEELEEDDYQDKFNETLEYYFRKSNGSSLSNSEKNELVDLVDEYTHCSVLKEDDVICDILKILDGVEYVTGQIVGSSQGDWQDYICPKALEDKMNYIEAVYFNTGTEYKITLDEYDEEPDMNEVECYFDYTWHSLDNEVKKWIAENNHVNLDDVVLLEGDF